jgi:hypothetical protein
MIVVLAAFAFDVEADQRPARAGPDVPGMYSSHAEPQAIALDRLLDHVGAMPMEHLVPALLGAVRHLSKYPRPETAPEIRRVARERIAELACPGPCGVRAIYLPGEGIFIDERMQPETDLFDRSVLLHELVHYVQDLANERGDMEPCGRWHFRELEAYAIQKRFLLLSGSQKGVGYSGSTTPCDRPAAPEGAGGAGSR